MKKGILLFSLVSFALLLSSCNEGSSVTSSSSEEGNKNVFIGTDVGESYKGNPIINTGLSVEKKEEALNLLESYAYKNYLAGLPLYESNTYTFVNPRVKVGFNKFIKGYGVGLLEEGEILTPREELGEYKDYLYLSYFSYEANLNPYVRDKGKENPLSNVLSPLFSKKLNSSKDNYVYYGNLAKDDSLLALDDVYSQFKVSSKWRVEVNVGVDGLKYKSNNSYDQKEIELGDYVYSLKYCLDNRVGLYYEVINGTLPIKNAKKYIEGSCSFDEVGYVATSKDGKSYLEIEFEESFTEDSVKDMLSNRYLSPISKSYVESIGVGNYAKDAASILCTGPYYLEKFDEVKNQAETYYHPVLTKNALWIHNSSGLYKIPGIYIERASGASSNITKIGFVEAVNGKVDYGVGSDYDLFNCTDYKESDVKNDPRFIISKSDSRKHLTFNTLNKEDYENVFGKKGQFAFNEREVKPWMSTSSFVEGICHSVDVDSIIGSELYERSKDILGTNSRFDGKTYKESSSHKKVVSDSYSKYYGYDLEVAKASFNKAIEEWVSKGLVTTGDKIELDIGSFYSESSLVNSLADSIKAAFDESSKALEYNLSLDFNTKLERTSFQKGAYDLYLWNYSFDNDNIFEDFKYMFSSSLYSSSRNVLTTKVADELIFNGKKYSFEGLVNSFIDGSCSLEGNSISPIKLYFDKNAFKVLEGQSLRATVNYELNESIIGVDLKIYNVDDISLYSLHSATSRITKNNGSFDILFSEEEADLLLSKNYVLLEFEVTRDIGGVKSTAYTYSTIYGNKG